MIFNQKLRGMYRSMGIWILMRKKSIEADPEMIHIIDLVIVVAIK